MQFKLTLRPVSPKTLVPFNYAYKLSGFIYSVLAGADAQYAHFLHEQGYPITSTRRFKLFTFSDLIMPKIVVDAGAGGMWVNSPCIEWIVSFYVDTAAQHFLMGLFQDQRCVIMSNLQRAAHRAEFTIDRVEALPVRITSPVVRLRTLSPVVIALKDERGMDQYLHPAHEQFGPLLVANLWAKYRSIQADRQATALPGSQPADAMLPGSHPADAMLRYRLLSDAEESVARPSVPKSRLVTIKEGSGEQTQLRGYYGFTFDLEGPVELLELAVLAGVGRYNAEGFGCVGIVGK
ncbi:CRISPR-associated endoribonuclease Cas6 [Spirosoma linguale]|uniref:CRISPR-associated protein Cas6 n=1 Tax=Spirosoma linguale (strain ATCC 33905 / DSM 74 / LMG 10896 / Claus 1) TaxID=504472 RepID=D2QHN8_SPILD|nr:CRISPR-associated protein Cas6 [Spirosoma linguale DSM 74]